MLAGIDVTRLVLLVVLQVLLAGWVYWHASRHGSRYPIAWGVAALIAPVLALAAYFVNYYYSRRRI